MVKLLNPQQEGSLVSILLLDCPPELMLPYRNNRGAPRWAEVLKQHLPRNTHPVPV